MPKNQRSTERGTTSPTCIRGAPVVKDCGMTVKKAGPFGNLKALQTWDVSFPGKWCRRVSLKTDPSILYPYQLLVIDAVQIINQFLELSIEVKIWGVVHQIQEGRVALVGLDGVGMILLGAWGIGIRETLQEDIPAFFCDERIILALLIKEGLGLFRNCRHGAVDGQKLVSAGRDEISQNFEGFVRVLGAFPDAEGISIHTAADFTVCTDGLNAELEFVASIAEFAQAAGVPGLGQAHRSLAGIEYVASQEFR